MATYIRRYPRDPYEGQMVEALVACGYEVRLSTDFEDERLGFDAFDSEYCIAIDFHVGSMNSSRYAQKLAKEACGKVRIFHISLELHDELAVTRGCGRKALEMLSDAYEEFIARVCPRTKSKVSAA